MVKICETVEYYGSADRCVFLIFRDTLVVCVSFRMPDLAIAEIISFRILQVETYSRNPVNREVCEV